MKYIYLIWRNLTRKKIRTFLTVASIFIAFVLFGVLMSLEAAFTSGVELIGLDRMITIHKVSLVQLLPQSYQNKILGVEGVSAVGHAVWFGGVYQDPKNFFAQIAVSEDFIELYPELRLPEEQLENWRRNRIGALVGKPTAERFGWEVGDRIPIQGAIWRLPDDAPWEFILEGIYEADQGFDDTQFFFHHEYLAEGTGVEGQVGWYVLRIEVPERSAEVAKEVDRLFANSTAETKTSTEKAFVQGFANQVGNIGAIVTGVVSIVFFTLLLVAGNTMAQSVRERTGELGVMKTLGFTGNQVMGLVLGESLLLTLLGGGTGLALVAFVTRKFDLGGAILPTLYFPPKDLLLGGVLVLAMAFLTGFLPARKALRLEIVDALRRG